MKFSEMKLSPSTLNALESMNFIEPTEVQEKAIPLLLNSKDIMVRSQTGTGKTAAFGIGLIEQITKHPTKKSLILAPTRELAIQITKDLRAIGTNHRLRIFVIYGGEDIERQFALLAKGYDIVIATPGRLLDHYRRGTVELKHFNLVVLDEADRMLDMGFKEDLDMIMSNVARERQTMLFSATLSEQVRRIAASYLLDPEYIEVGPAQKAETIEEEFLRMPRKEKFEALKRILHREPQSRILIFVATQRSTEYLSGKLFDNGIKSGYFHGGMRQGKRERTVRDFKEGRFRILIATDVASRGLHIEDIGHVISYDEANDQDTHLHRVGRTGRMGKKGKAITFIETDKFEREVNQRKFSRNRRPPARRSHGQFEYRTH